MSEIQGCLIGVLLIGESDDVGSNLGGPQTFCKSPCTNKVIVNACARRLGGRAERRFLGRASKKGDGSQKGFRVGGSQGGFQGVQGAGSRGCSLLQAMGGGGVPTGWGGVRHKVWQGVCLFQNASRQEAEANRIV